MAKQKHYVVWRGACPGIYASWEACEQQVKGVKGAAFKAFDTREEAERAFAEGVSNKPRASKPRDRAVQPAWIDRPAAGAPELNALAVDAACSGNPGKMEYQGVYVANGQRLFHHGPLHGTNNIGEFLAIVHGLAYLKREGLALPLYSDSLIAQGWVRKKKCATKLERNAKTAALFNLIERAEQWLKSNTYTTRILKWDKDKWGEIPADFGRK